MENPILFVFALLAGLALFFAILFIVLSLTLGRSGGYAPGWQLRCLTCGHTGDAASSGIVRMGAASMGKRILGRCSNCGRLRWLALERKPPAETAAV